MGGMRVKDMPRNQQKAVFASMGKGSDERYLRALEGAEGYRKRREFLIKKHELAETTEDKIAAAMADKSLSHRQTMAKIAQIKAEAADKLNKLQTAERAPSTVGEIRRIREWRTKPQVVEVGETKVKIPALTGEEAKKRVAFEHKLMLTPEYRAHRKKGLTHDEAISKVVEQRTSPEKGKKWWERKIRTDEPPAVANNPVKQANPKERPHLTEAYARYRIRDPEEFQKDSFRTHDVGREGHSKRIAGRLKNTGKWETQSILVSRKEHDSGSYLQQENGRLRIIHPGAKLSEDAEASVIKKSKALRKDTDKDGVPDVIDCEPKNPKKHGKTLKKAKRITSAFFGVSAEGRKFYAIKSRKLELEDKYTQLEHEHYAASTRDDSVAVARVNRKMKTVKSEYGRLLKKQAAVLAGIEKGKATKQRKKKNNPNHMRGKNMTYSQLKKSKIEMKGRDADGDGVPNSKDCRPLDKKKQDIFKKGSFLSKVAKGRKKGKKGKRGFVERTVFGKTSEEKLAAAKKREAAARERVAIVEARARAARLEQEAEHAEVHEDAERLRHAERLKQSEQRRKKKEEEPGSTMSG